MIIPLRPGYERLLVGTQEGAAVCAEVLAQYVPLATDMIRRLGRPETKLTARQVAKMVEGELTR